MNEVLHKHSVIRPGNNSLQWCRGMSWGCVETGKVQAVSLDVQQPSSHKVLGAGSAPGNP